MLLTMLADGWLHLSGIAKLAPHLTEANREALLARAAHKSKREIEELVTEFAPRPDVPTVIRKLPDRPKEIGPAPNLQLGPDRVVSPRPAEPRPVEPLAPERYKVQFTASAELKDKIERLRALVPDSDLTVIIDEAVTEKLERLESRRYGKTRAPRQDLESTNTSPSSRHIPAAVRRAVSERDGNQCTFVDRQGRRCRERSQLQFHHKDPFARGGNHSAENIQMMCPTHNQYLAERDYGKEVMERFRGSSSLSREPGPIYSLTFQGVQGYFHAQR